MDVIRRVLQTFFWVYYTNIVFLLRSTYTCDQQVRDNLVVQAICEETHVLKPFTNQDSAPQTKSTQTITFQQSRSADQVMEGELQNIYLCPNYDQFVYTLRSVTFGPTFIIILSPLLCLGFTYSTFKNVLFVLISDFNKSI